MSIDASVFGDLKPLKPREGTRECGICHGDVIDNKNDIKKLNDTFLSFGEKEKEDYIHYISNLQIQKGRLFSYEELLQAMSDFKKMNEETQQNLANLMQIYRKRLTK